MEVGAGSRGLTRERGRLGGNRSGGAGQAGARDPGEGLEGWGLSAPLFRSLSPCVFFFGLQFPGGNDNYLTITGPSHPFLSGAEVSESCRRWGDVVPRQRLELDGGGGRELGRTVAEASSVSKGLWELSGEVGEREAAVIRKPVCGKGGLVKQRVLFCTGRTSGIVSFGW